MIPSLSQKTTVTPDDPRVIAAVEEYVRALEAGERPDRIAFLERHAEVKSVLAGCLDGLQFLREARPQLDDSEVDAIDHISAAPLGDFRLLREIGRGGMGVVYEAEQISLGRRVALKVLPFAATMDSRQLKRFQNEARAAAGLHHTNIVPVHFVGCERSVHFYAMQFIDGQDLASILNQSRAEESRTLERPQQEIAPDVATQDAQAGQAAAPAALPGTPTLAIAGLSTERSPRSREHFRTVARLGIQAAEALDYAHQMGIVHRDIKPGNLLVDADGRLWVTDFGLAHIQSDSRLTTTGDLVGTVRYMSPEQALAKRVIVDHRTDIYSLGATLYELLTLEPVFDGRDRQELLRQIAFEEPKAPRRVNKSIPAELETIVQKALEKNPAARYATAQEMAEDLHRFVLDEPIRARRPSLVRRARGWCRRHKMLVTGAVAVAVTFLLTGTAITWSQMRQRNAIERTATEDLKEAQFWQQKEEWSKAQQALERAVVRLGPSGPLTLQMEVDKRRREVALVARLEEARLKASCLSSHGFPDYAGAQRAFALAFGENDLDLSGASADEVANRIRASAIRPQLVAALDYWAYFKDRMRDGSGQQLRAIARLADNSAWGRRLRDPEVVKDTNELQRLAQAKDILDQAPPNLLILSYLLDRAKAPAPGVLLLRQAQERHPGDFWINFQLADLLANDPKTTADAAGYLRAAMAIQPHSPWVQNSLGVTLWKLKRLPEAAAAYRRAIKLAPNFALPHANLAAVLPDDRQTEAEAECHKAIELDPGCAFAYINLASCLIRRGMLPDAVEACRKAITITPDYAHAYVAMANATRRQHKHKEAEAICRKAIDIQPDYVLAYVILADILNDQGKHKEAEVAGRKAITLQDDDPFAHQVLAISLIKQNRIETALTALAKAAGLNPDFADAYHAVGLALREQGKLAEAKAAYQKVIQLRPGWEDPYINLGNILGRDERRFPEAVAAFRKALELNPDCFEAYYNLGNALTAQMQLSEALAAYNNVVRIKPKTAIIPGLALAFYNLGCALSRQRKWPEAIAAYRKTIEIQTDYAEAHCNLGSALLELGEFTDALLSSKRGHQFGSARPNWQYPSADWVRRAERLLQLDAKLPQFLNGDTVPGNPTERLAVAQLCQLPCRQYYAASVRFFAEAFAADPKLGSPNAFEANPSPYFMAGCAAVLAGSGKGKDAANLESKVYARLRGQALVWLRTDLAERRSELDKWLRTGLPLRRLLDEQGQTVRAAGWRERMGYWHQNPDFAGVRSAAALAKLPEAERQEWQKLWQEAEELTRRAEK
jgi:serine/threonine protein kinase/Flp pilus assembly protein TadD